ncbi:uncharacterized protein LOC117642251 isoform X2 [Thrips palmi]|uniref:Uncharacterized protein LOC117642251 isoform X2 n=1 Tax=Thrips palmi TaxID=161013 RepID=A0A6P8YGR5_THRPL|nr:uncharacterized protein LOC117642251 isoform X2 [Thrips palmi]
MTFFVECTLGPIRFTHYESRPARPEYSLTSVRDLPSASELQREIGSNSQREVSCPTNQLVQNSSTGSLFWTPDVRMPPKKRSQTSSAGEGADKRSRQSSPSQQQGTSAPSPESEPMDSEPMTVKEELSSPQLADPLISATQQSQSMFWCRDCGKDATEECGDLGHTLWSQRKRRAGQAVPKLQRLQNAAASARQVVQALLDARDAVEAQLEAWRSRLRRVEETEKQLWAAAEQGGDLEAFQLEGLEQLHEAAVLLADRSTLSLQVAQAGADCKWKADLPLEAALRTAFNPLLLLLHQNGGLVRVFHPDECLDVLELSQQQEHCQLLNDVLQKPGLSKVKKLSGLHCQMQPNWSKLLLQRVAPHVEWLRVVYARREHLDVIRDMPALRYLQVLTSKVMSDDHAPELPLQLVDLTVVNVSKQHLLSVQRMPNLRKLALTWHSRPLDETFPPLPQGHRGLQWLWVGLRPLSTVLSLAEAHAATLQELRILCASEGDSEWHFKDLAEGLRQCGLVALRRVVLLRGVAPTFPNSKLPHTKDTCRKQKKSVWDKLLLVATDESVKAVEVFCGECDKFPAYPYLGNFEMFLDTEKSGSTA